MRWVLLFLTWSAWWTTAAQNLVPNGDFEQYTQCPDYVSQIDRATGWSRPTEGTSDYLNACLGQPYSLSVPGNQFGDQAARSGNGYAGFYCFYGFTAADVPGEDDREYVTHALSSPLVPGQTYAVEFFVSLGDVSKYAVNDIGALLSTSIPQRSDELAITGTPQISHADLSLLDDKTGWMRIHGCFVADSAYAYITIGNFRTAATTVYQEVATNFPLTYFSYYYVDDVSVHAIEAPELGADIVTCSTAQLTVQNPDPNAIYSWSTGETGTTISVDSSGIYQVWTEVFGCMVSDSIAVLYHEPITLTLPSDTANDFCTTRDLVLRVDDLPAGAEVMWSTGATSPTISVTTPGSYSVNVTAPDHCAAETTVMINDRCSTPLYAPNAFTPNGDGINDAWRPVWKTNANSALEFTVFDRWGRSLFHGATPEASWDGTTDGSPLPSGVYAWTGRAWDPDTGERWEPRGHLVLVR